MKIERALIIAAGLGAVAVAFYLWKRGVKGVASDAVNAAGQAATGAVLGIGDQLGVPRTDATKCQQAIAAGDTWTASFACDATTFIKYLFGGSGKCTDCASSAPVTTPYDYGTGSPGVPLAPGAADPGFQMTDFAQLGKLSW